MEVNSGEADVGGREHQLNVELLPGTEVMTDIGAHHFVKSSGRSQQVLVPQPSTNKHDPLNWSTSWKTSAIIAATFATFSQNFGPLSLAPMFGDLAQEFDCSLADAVQFSGVAVLILGFSNFIWVPISTSFGRRPVYLASQLICLGASIWRARATTYGSFMGACILNGIGAGPAESIEPAVIADIFFLHDRGKWNTLYWLAYMGSVMVSPIAAGSMAVHVGWRKFWWLNVALIGVSIIMVIFMFPETKWHRARAVERKSESLTTGEGVADDVKTLTSVEENKALTINDSDVSAIKATPQDPWLGRGGPSKAQWGLYAPNPTPLRSILLDLWVPWKLFAFPIVEFAAFAISWTCSFFLSVNLTQTQNFAAPPYNWTSESVGFTNFAILVGAVIGLITAGPLSDWVSARATRRNNGIREPEMRLPAMIPYVVVMYVGNIIVSVGYEKKWPWEVIVIIGYTCAGITGTSLPGIISTYAVDSYKPVAGSLFVAITVNKNVWGYGLSKFITDWIIRDGYIPPIMTNASLTLLFCLFGILFYYKGKTFRRWSKDSSVHRL